jgi:hypothetical protein
MSLFLIIILVSSFVMVTVDILVAAPMFSIPIWLIFVCIYGGITAEILLDGFIAFIFELFVSRINVRSKCFAVAKWEQKLYRFLGVGKIKTKLPDLGKIGKFAKNEIESPHDPQYLKLYMQHGIAGEIEHGVSAILGFAIIFVFPLEWIFYFGLPIAAVNAVLNILPIAVLRYNRSRILPIYQRQLKRQTASSAAAETPTAIGVE